MYMFCCRCTCIEWLYQYILYICTSIMLVNITELYTWESAPQS